MCKSTGFFVGKYWMFVSANHLNGRFIGIRYVDYFKLLHFQTKPFEDILVDVIILVYNEDGLMKQNLLHQRPSI